MMATTSFAAPITASAASTEGARVFANACAHCHGKKGEGIEREGKLRRSKIANIFSGGARETETHAPLYGEHTREILAEVGYSAADIDKMVAGKAVTVPAKR